MRTETPCLGPGLECPVRIKDDRSAQNTDILFGDEDKDPERIFLTTVEMKESLSSSEAIRS